MPESTRKFGPIVCHKQLVLINQAHTADTLCTRRGKLPRNLLWRTTQYWPGFPFNSGNSRMTSELPMICSPHFTRAFPHLHSRSQTHFALNALTAYWKPTGNWCSVLRTNYVIFKISKRHIFSSNKEQILTELWAVGSGHPSATLYFDSGEIAHEDQRLLERQDQLSRQKVKIKHRWEGNAV